ncbi:MAG: hypothetical protein BJ554DRAFT_5215 [Olpidium bornovanus]|uniref:Uncharacterized protein n=1 Tax=Olpidium bornovanus TaxID=278681 RepID=A0A8H7ZIB1_9FUNG|nr:MAG: hypothetical protein BJ554DRAFT_5215 [Olpidium bornovanus]
MCLRYTGFRDDMRISSTGVSFRPPRCRRPFHCQRNFCGLTPFFRRFPVNSAEWTLFLPGLPRRNRLRLLLPLVQAARSRRRACVPVPFLTNAFPRSANDPSQASDRVEKENKEKTDL